MLRENSYASSVIELAPQQRVVTTGPYHWMRHPMYTGFLVMSAATPLTLGSYFAEALVLPTVGLFIVRLLAEEKYLALHLPCYRSYMASTRSRLLPGLW